MYSTYFKQNCVISQNYSTAQFFLQNALFYVLSDDIETSKILLEEKIKADYPIKFPGNGIDHRPGMITYRNQVLHRGRLLVKLMHIIAKYLIT